MIDCTISVQCDGAIDGDLCPAEFLMQDAGVDPIRVAHQIQQRGWRTVALRVAPGNRIRVLCPLHPATGTETDDA